MSLYDVIANPQRSGLGEAAYGARDEKRAEKKEKTLMEIIDATKDLKIKAENAANQDTVNKAEAQKRLADKYELSNVMQVGTLKNADQYRERLDLYFENRFPNLPEEEKIGKLKEFGLSPTFDTNTKTTLLNLDREVVNDVEQRQNKELQDYSARLKLQLEGSTKGDGLKPESPRAKLAADVENYGRDAQQRLVSGDIAGAAASLNISNAAAKQLQELDRSEQAATWAKESQEMEVSLGRVFPELAAMTAEDYSGPAADKQTLDAVQRDFKAKLEEFKSFPSAELALQREWAVENAETPGTKIGGFELPGTSGEQLKFRRRTVDEIKEFDKNFFTLQTDADTASEMLQALEMELQEASKGRAKVPLGMSSSVPAVMQPRK